MTVAFHGPDDFVSLMVTPTATPAREVGTPPQAVPWHALEESEVLGHLGSRLEGLTNDEAAARLARHGANVLPVAEPETALRILVRQLKSVVVALLVAAALIAFFLGDRLEAAAI